MMVESFSFSIEDKAHFLPIPENRHLHPRLVLNLSEKPHHGRQSVQGLAVHFENDVAVLEPQLVDNSGFLDSAEFEPLDFFPRSSPPDTGEPRTRNSEDREDYSNTR